MAQVMELGEPGAELAEALRDDVEHAACRCLRDFLREPRDARATFDLDHAVIGFDVPGDELHQRRLARTVAADDADPFVRLQREFDAVEQQRTADAVVDLTKLQQGHCGTA